MSVSSRTVQPDGAPDDVLRVEHIAKSFGPVTALRDVSLHLRKGEVLGLDRRQRRRQVHARQDPLGLPPARRGRDLACSANPCS